ncbi:MAG: alpha/beta hydrolase [Candidatus Binatia bacterium]
MTSDTNTTNWQLGWTSFGVLLSSWLGGPVEWMKNVFVFHPHTKVEGAPSDYSLPFEDVWFGGPDGKLLHGWYIPSMGHSAVTPEPLFLWFHGNAGNVSHRLAHLHLLYRSVGGSHFVFDYQGFGNSRGKPSISGILEDGRAAIALVHKRGWASGKTIVYFGESLGAAVVVTLAAEIPPSRTVLLAPFYSLRAMGDIRLPPLSFLVEHDLNSARLIGNLQSPLLVIHGTEDRTIPFRQGKDLYDLAPQPKRFYMIEGAAHTDLHNVGGETYLHIIREFVS